MGSREWRSISRLRQLRRPLRLPRPLRGLALKYRGYMSDSASNPKLNRINLICLGVADLIRSRAFYRDGLGFETPNNEENPEIVFFDNGGTKLELFQREELAADIGGDSPPTTSDPAAAFNGITLAYNAKTKEEVDAIFAKIESIGGTIAKAPNWSSGADTAATSATRTATTGKLPTPTIGSLMPTTCLSSNSLANPQIASTW